jgi:hypothetical protein
MPDVMPDQLANAQRRLGPVTTRVCEMATPAYVSASLLPGVKVLIPCFTVDAELARDDGFMLHFLLRSSLPNFFRQLRIATEPIVARLLLATGRTG